jgi:hypothetical protein
VPSTFLPAPTKKHLFLISPGVIRSLRINRDARMLYVSAISGCEPRGQSQAILLCKGRWALHCFFYDCCQTPRHCAGFNDAGNLFFHATVCQVMKCSSPNKLKNGQMQERNHLSFTSTFLDNSVTFTLVFNFIGLPFIIIVFSRSVFQISG